MNSLPIIFRDGHLFVELDGGLWLFDTGSPASFGDLDEITFDDERFQLGNDYMGLSASTLSQYIGVECLGLIGADILSHFDHLFDIPNGELTITTGHLKHAGTALPLSEFMGIPILTAQIEGRDYRMFFDTGAQVSYFQDDSIESFPSAGSITDFYPGFGQFQTDTYQVPISLSDCDLTLRCGRLSGLLAATFTMADTSGIIGNQILENRVTGYFPRRNLLCL
jgi:hypothetical protein